MKSFDKLVNDLTKSIQQMPQRIATHAVLFSKRRFQKQNWHDQGAEPWKKRSRKRRGGRNRQSGAVLVDSGRLKRSIRKIAVTKNYALIGTDVPYAEMHNEGLKGSVSVKQHNRRSRKGKKHVVKSHTRQVNMPKRKFIGESALLMKQLEQLIVKELENAIRR